MKVFITAFRSSNELLTDRVLLIKIILYTVKVPTNEVRQSDRMIEEQGLFQALKRPNARFLSAFKTKQKKSSAMATDCFRNIVKETPFRFRKKTKNTFG